MLLLLTSRAFRVTQLDEGNATTHAHHEVDALRHALSAKDAEVAAAYESRRQFEAAAVAAEGGLDAMRREQAGSVAERGKLEAAIAAEKTNTQRERER
jgi:hypothetical protein